MDIMSLMQDFMLTEAVSGYETKMARKLKSCISDMMSIAAVSSSAFVNAMHLATPRCREWYHELARRGRRSPQSRVLGADKRRDLQEAGRLC